MRTEKLHDIYCSYTRYFLRDQIEEDEMGGACGMYWGKGEMHTGFFKGNLKGDH
jgi:hypothetical protein